MPLRLANSDLWTLRTLVIIMLHVPNANEPVKGNLKNCSVGVSDRQGHETNRRVVVLLLCSRVEKMGEYGKDGTNGTTMQVSKDKGPERYPRFFKNFAQALFRPPMPVRYQAALRPGPLQTTRLYGGRQGENGPTCPKTCPPAA